MESLGAYSDRLESRVLAPLQGVSWRFYTWVGFLLILIGIAAYAYFTQLRDGLVVTGLSDRISWGMYITLFVFFIGISHAGTLISAILRASGAHWRMPVVRMAEFITVVALMVGAIMPIIDLGRPDRIANILLFGRWQSPQIWDVLAITTYLTGSLIYLYLPMIPDFAIARDRLNGRLRWRKKAYGALALGWRGAPAQVRHHRTSLTVMMVVIIAIAVSVHTVVSWIFSMTLREPWDSAVFGAFFVAGAIFSGIAMLIIMMYVLRRVYHLEEYITPRHFRFLGYLMAVFTLIMLYFNISEYLTPGYKSGEATVFHLDQLFAGPFAGLFWYYIVGGLIIPGLLFLIPTVRSHVFPIVAAAGMVVVAMWIERYYIVVSGLRAPLLPYDPRDYTPSWVEWAIVVGSLALFALLITLFAKLVPVISMWEVEEEFSTYGGLGEPLEPDARAPAPIAAVPVSPAPGGGD